MSFAENLKQIRTERHLSQEELAELLDVSRQAVSKWESGQGYPETETLLRLAGRLNLSLDSLMRAEIPREAAQQNPAAAGVITITSPHENVIAACCKVISSPPMRGGKAAPQYALFGVSAGAASFWGEPNTFLGWYADYQQISREITEISRAITAGLPAYTLQYSARTRRRWASVKIIGDPDT